MNDGTPLDVVIARMIEDKDGFPFIIEKLVDIPDLYGGWEIGDYITSYMTNDGKIAWQKLTKT